MSQRFYPVPQESYVTSPFGPRDGGFHYGTDFGLEGGSAGMAVYAAQAGTVVNIGAATGYGGPDPAGWVVLDHDDSQGGGQTVYGHVVREVELGQQVQAGQRIAHVNPDTTTNGRVAPHLHFEVHPYVFAPGHQLNAEEWLAGCPHPGEHGEPVKVQDGVVFGVDVSEHQNGMSLVRAAAEGMSFAIIRVADGTYLDRVYHSHAQDAETAGLAMAAYHYLRSPAEGTTIRQQVQAAVTHMGSYRLPMWLDCETDAGLDVEDVREAKRVYEELGIKVLGVYSYVPYWENRVSPAEPDTHEFGHLWVAAYGRNDYGAPSTVYPGNSAPQWVYPLGNQAPALWQFGSNGLVAGFAVDVNAFRGDVEGIRALFGATQATPPVQEAPPTAVEPETVKPAPATPVEPPKVEDMPPVQEAPTPPPVTVPAPPRTVMDLILDMLVRLIVGKRPR